ncbi:MAG: hypothetical protein K9N40_09945 [Candidatus Cloacimonetes bacterium]|nr:hypothetical protein [Candidatus Cloacimonadota bacterium]
MKAFLKSIDGVISLSKKNREIALRIFNVPVSLAFPFPKDLDRLDIERKKSGSLYR